MLQTGVSAKTARMRLEAMKESSHNGAEVVVREAPVGLVILATGGPLELWTANERRKGS